MSSTMQSGVYTVSQINKYIKGLISDETALQDIWVKGEISNYRPHYSGHMYFTLKDEGGVLKAVMFKGYSSTIRFVPDNGMSVLARGQISVYERDGQYQLVVTELIPEGTGNLYKAYEQLKEKLEKEGLFEASHKKPLPFLPGSIALITSSTGSVIRDMINIITRRFPEMHLKLFPTAVQGDLAAPQISSAIRAINRSDSADVIIIARGGGSIEDLWTFNEEAVARSIYESHIPVVSAVGHETDYTIADFVADLRAPTPSAAAELVVPEKSALLRDLLQYSLRMGNAIRQTIANSRKKVDNLAQKGVFIRPFERINQERQNLDSLSKDLSAAIAIKAEKSRHELSVLSAGLNAMSPLAILARGYSVTARTGLRKTDVIRSVDEVSVNDKLDVILSDGSLKCIVEDILSSKREGGKNNGG